jgi:hypothetical protein
MSTVRQHMRCKICRCRDPCHMYVPDYALIFVCEYSGLCLTRDDGIMHSPLLIDYMV